MNNKNGSNKLKFYKSGYAICLLLFFILNTSVYAQDSAPQDQSVPTPAQTTLTPMPDEAAQSATPVIPPQDIATPESSEITSVEGDGVIPQTPISEQAVDITLPPADTDVPAKEITLEEKSTLTEASKKIPSLFFTYWQHQSILDAVASRGSNPTASTSEEDLGSEENSEEEPMEKPVDRELRLSGIVFVHDKDWTIWFNEMRITPDAIPPEIISLKVFKEHIDVKWFDKYTNKIFPVRMRPHQRFNLDTRIFLPG